MSARRQSAQYLTAGVIFGAVAFLMLAAAFIAIDGVLWRGADAALLPIGAIFGLIGCGATAVTCYAFGMVRS